MANNENNAGVGEVGENNRRDDSQEGRVQVSSGRFGTVSTNQGRRGRPLESMDSPNTLQSQLIEISDGSDIAQTIQQYARERQIGIHVFSASGTVTFVAIIQPSTTGSVMVLHGQYNVMSLTGTFMSSSAPQGCNMLTIYLSGEQGRVVGGLVVGSLLAVGPVMVTATTFTTATYERLPLEEEVEGVGGDGATAVQLDCSGWTIDWGFKGVHGNLPRNLGFDGDSGSTDSEGGSGSGGAGELNDDDGFGWTDGRQPPL